MSSLAVLIKIFLKIVIFKLCYLPCNFFQILGILFLEAGTVWRKVVEKFYSTVINEPDEVEGGNLVVYIIFDVSELVEIYRHAYCILENSTQEQ